MNGIKIKYSNISSNSCTLEFKSDVEGVATTYANLYRRVLLQSTPRYSVAGIRCCANGNYAKNFFEVVPGLTTSLIDINTSLFNAVFNIEGGSDIIILSIELDGTVRLSDFCDMSKVSVKFGTDFDNIDLVSQDKPITSVIGNNNVTLDIFLRKSVGFSNKDVNIEALKEVIGENELRTWIVGDSQHRGVVSVSYHSNVILGRQTVTMEVKSHENNIEEVVRGCTEHITNILKEFDDNMI